MKKKIILFLLFLIPILAFAFTYDWEIDYMEYANDATAQTAYVSSDTNPIAKATGGNISYDGLYVIHTFLSGADFIPSSTFDVEYLVVAGGGGGGNHYGGGGGGGAGGLLTDTEHEVTAKEYAITVGDGGAGVAAASYGNGTVGEDSVFDTLTADGGGYGGGNDGVAGGAGGSGGGGAYGSGSGGSATAGQGYAGGDGSVKTGLGHETGGGGGGKSEVGTTGVLDKGGDGGDGTASSISGSSITYAGGGGGGTNTNATATGDGGLGGGGDGGQRSGASGVAGTANTGGGGGGGGTSAPSASGAGGSGIVIIRYLGAPKLQSYSESTIKQQGSYSLKGIAVITDSLNDTLTRTLADNLDLSNSEAIEYDIYALRTGSNIKIGIHDSGGTTTEHTANVASSNVNQTESWDISAITDANKDDIDSIIITILNADAANTFYLDDLKAGITPAAGGSYTFVQ